jgi:threonine dehydrogenase-like Zn-dependent dehydrogenase
MGAYAEYLAVKAAAVAKKPSNLSFEEAASVPVASQTAWHGLFTHGCLEKGQTVLIHGGAGAVGGYAVQLASHAGARVIATAARSDEAYLKAIGASLVINYRGEPFEKVLQEKVDVVFDLVGGDAQKRSFRVTGGIKRNRRRGSIHVTGGPRNPGRSVCGAPETGDQVVGEVARADPVRLLPRRVGRNREEDGLSPDIVGRVQQQLRPAQAAQGPRKGTGGAHVEDRHLHVRRERLNRGAEP